MVNWGQYMGGLAVGAGNVANRPGQYYVKANYKGNGLADTGLGYISNPTYQNPYDQGTLMSSLINGGGNILGSLGNLGKLSSSNLSNSQYGLPTKQYDLSWLGNSLGSIGGSNNLASSFDYSLPTKDYDYNLGWLTNSLDNNYSLPTNNLKFNTSWFKK